MDEIVIRHIIEDFCVENGFHDIAKNWDKVVGDIISKKMFWCFFGERLHAGSFPNCGCHKVASNMYKIK